MRRLVLPLLGAALAFAGPAKADELRDALKAEMPELMTLYRDLHAHPELSFQEVETSARLAGLMRELGFDVTEQVGRTGLVAVMRNGEGPTVLIRTDMDALPVTEQTGLPFASQERGVPESGVESGIMHACAHDTHMTAWIAAARLLVSRKDEWQGTLVMIAQPAEELGEGALAMLEDGLFERFPKPDFALAFHNSAQLPAGTIGIAAEYAWANVDSVDITVKGVGGHGAYPHATKDPVVLASSIVMKLQTLASRESSPLEPVVVTVGSFHAGTKHNIIPDEARLQLTVRSYTDASRELLLTGIERIATGEAIAAGIPEESWPTVSVKENYTPAVYNSPELAAQVAADLSGRFGEGRVIEIPSTMGGEDFGRYRRADPDHIQSLLLSIGGVPQGNWEAAEKGELDLPSLHSPFWAPDAETVIETAAEAFAATAIELMPPN